MKILPALLQRAPASERSRFEAAAVNVKLPAGKQMLALRETPGVMAFPVTGTIRVYLVSREGREITLYRIKPGGSCVLTASCILGGSGFPALAEVEKEVLAWAALQILAALRFSTAGRTPCRRAGETGGNFF